MNWKVELPLNEISGEITEKSVVFAQGFGTYLGTDDKEVPEDPKSRTKNAKVNTNQLRKFFGEVKRQQMQGFNRTDFVMLKPKLAYAVGRVDKKEEKTKMKDLYEVLVLAMDRVSDEKSFRNFIKIFEAIVAYHKAASAGIK